MSKRLPAVEAKDSRKAGRVRTRPDSSSDIAALQRASQEQFLDSAVERIVDEWAAVVPSLDHDVRAIAARTARIDGWLRARTAAVLKTAGLSDNEFRLLAALMRIGSPHRAAPTEIAGRYVPVTSGGLTGLANRLEQRNLISRVSHPSDQRSLLIELTDAGKQLALDTMIEFAHIEQQLMAGVSQADRAKINALLRKLLHSIEKTLP